MCATKRSQRETWYSTVVGGEVDVYLPYLRLHAFRSRILNDAPHLHEGAVAVFARYDIEKGLATWFFAPEALPLAQVFGARPCEKPLRDEAIVLLSGDARAWDIHFPGLHPR